MEWMHAPIRLKQLFDFIHALTSEEIKSFKDAKHIPIRWKQLIELFLSCQQFEETYLQQQLAQINFEESLKEKDWIVKLYRYIMDEISLDYAKTATEQIILQSYIDVLIAKKQYELAGHVLKKAKKQAEWEENLPILYLLLERERTLMSKIAPNTIAIRRELIEVNKKLMNFLEYENIMEEVLLLSNEFRINPTSEQRTRYTHMLQYPQLQQEKRALSINAKIQYNLSLALIHYSLNAYKDSLVHFKRTIDLFDAHWEQLKMEMNVKRYVAVYNNYLSVSVSVQEYALALQIIEQIKDIPNRVAAMEKSPHLQDYLFYTTRISELTIYCNTAAYTKGYQLIDEIYQYIKGMKIAAPFEYGFYMYAAEVCLVLQKYQECRYWTTKIIAAKSKDLSMIEDNIAKSYIFNILIGVEQNDVPSTLESIKTFKQFLQEFKRRSGFELLFTSFIESLLQTTTVDTERRIYEENIPIMQAFLNKPPFNGRYIKFDIVGWMESRWRKVPLVMVFKEKLHTFLNGVTS